MYTHESKKDTVFQFMGCSPCTFVDGLRHCNPVGCHNLWAPNVAYKNEDGEVWKVVQITCFEIYIWKFLLQCYGKKCNYKPNMGCNPRMETQPWFVAPLLVWEE